MAGKKKQKGPRTATSALYQAAGVAGVLLVILAGCAGGGSNSANPNIEQYGVRVDTTNQLMIYHPTYRHVDLVCAVMPSMEDSDVIFCAEAAFTGRLLDEFDHTNIMGPHICGGIEYVGYDYDQNYGLFAATDSIWQFASLPNNALIDSTAAQGGMAFVQYWVIRDGRIYMPQIQKVDKEHIYRAIADMDGELVIVESRQPVPYGLFTEQLHELPIRNALYLDMGAGWNHSFYRDLSGSLHIIHPHTHDYCTNWITFYK